VTRAWAEKFPRGWGANGKKTKNSIIKPLSRGGGNGKKAPKNSNKDQKIYLYLLYYICTMYKNPRTTPCPLMPTPIYHDIVN